MLFISTKSVHVLDITMNKCIGCCVIFIRFFMFCAMMISWRRRRYVLDQSVTWAARCSDVTGYDADATLPLLTSRHRQARSHYTTMKVEECSTLSWRPPGHPWPARSSLGERFGIRFVRHLRLLMSSKLYKFLLLGRIRTKKRLELQYVRLFS